MKLFQAWRLLARHMPAWMLPFFLIAAGARVVRVRFGALEWPVKPVFVGKLSTEVVKNLLISEEAQVAFCVGACRVLYGYSFALEIHPMFVSEIRRKRAWKKAMGDG